jgi:hypothetical protein
MSIVDAILDHSGHAEKIDQLVRKLQRPHRGWVLVDAANREDYAWVHARPFVRDEGFTPGLRREVRSADGFTGVAEVLSWLEPRFGYALVIAKPPGPPLPEVLGMLAHAQEMRLPFLVLELGERLEDLCYIDERGIKPRLPHPGPLHAETLALRLTGARMESGEWQLPLRLDAVVTEPRAKLEVDLIGRSNGFPRRSYGFLLERPPGTGAASGRLVLDVLPHRGQRDELILTAEGFPEVPRIQVYKSGVPGPRTRPARDETWRVHVLFDRTTLDVDQWPAALSAGFVRATAGRTDAGEDLSRLLNTPASAPASPAVESAGWNLRLRRSLAAALPQLTREMPGAELHLWWFADTPRAGIERHPVLESPRNAFAACGRCPSEHLAEVLESEQFGYCPGLDIYDAADEALEAIAAAIGGGASDRVYHAVIVVGDSPPPPRDPFDPLWRELPGRSVATNARCSEKFRQALAALGKLKVPVGWLFIRSPRGPAPEDGKLLGYRKSYPDFQFVKERILALLRATEGLITVETGTETDLEGPLRRLAALLGRGPGGIAGVDFALAPEAR